MNPDRSTMLWQGLLAGLIGYSTTVISFAVGNVVVGHSPFYTPALLGGALFYGVRDLAGVVVWAGPVLAYNGFHLVVFLVLGAFASWLAQVAERGPHLWYVGVTFYIFVAFHLYGVAFALPAPLRDALLGWGTMMCGMLASLAMALFLLWAHPRLRAEMHDFAAQDPDLVDTPR